MPRRNKNAVRGSGKGWGRDRIVIHPRRCGCKPCRTRRLYESGARSAA